MRGRILDFAWAGDDFAFQDDEGLYTAGFSHFQNSDDRLWGCGALGLFVGPEATLATPPHVLPLPWTNHRDRVCMGLRV